MHSEKVNKGHEFLVFLVFLLVSLCLWLLKVSSEIFETNVAMRVVVEKMPEGLELRDDKVELEVGVRVKGSKLLTYMFGKESHIEIPYSDFTDNDGVLSIETSKLTNKVEAAMPADFAFRFFEEEELVVRIKTESVLLPVKFESDIVAGKNVEYGGIELVPEKVLVTAPPSMLEEMDSVLFKAGTRINVAKDSLITYTLPHKKYTTYEPAVLTAKVKATPYSKVSVMRKLSVEDVPLTHIASLYGLPDSVKLTCLMPPSMTGKVDKEHFGVSVNSGNIRKGVKDTLFFTVSSLPSFVKEENVRLEPEYIILENIKPFGILNLFN